MFINDSSLWVDVFISMKMSPICWRRCRPPCSSPSLLTSTSASSAKSTCSRQVLLQCVGRQHINFPISIKALPEYSIYDFCPIFNKMKVIWRLYVKLESNKLWVCLQQMTYSLAASLLIGVKEEELFRLFWH